MGSPPGLLANRPKVESAHSRARKRRGVFVISSRCVRRLESVSTNSWKEYVADDLTEEGNLER